MVGETQLMPSNAIRFLPDTGIFVHYSRDDELARSIEQTYALKTGAKPVDVSVVTVGEIRALADWRGWGKVKRQRVDELLAKCRRIWIDTDALLDAYVELNVFSIKAGRAISDHDLWIAATARVIGATLLTTDKDFDHLHPTTFSAFTLIPTPPKRPDVAPNLIRTR